MFAGIAVLLILAAIVLQLLLCFHAASWKVRFLPAAVLLAGELLCAAAYGGCILLEKAGRGIYGGAFAAFLYAIILLAALSGTALAWLIWAIVKLVQNRRK